MRWQFARNTQLPCSTPSSSIREATGAWPCPSAQFSNLKPRVAASCCTCAVGSTPGDSTKMRGTVGVAVSKIAFKLKVGGSMYFWPRCVAMYFAMANRTRSRRSERSTSICCSSLHLLSQMPGRASSSGLGDMYQPFHSDRFCSNDWMRPLKTGCASSSVRLSQPASDSQSAAGLGRCAARSSTAPPLSRKVNSFAGILFSASRIFEQI